MATSIEEILGRDINSIKELREEIKRLQDSIANVDPTTQEFKDTTTKLIAAQQQLTSVTRASKDENVAAKDSIVGMEKEYKSLYNTYKMLTEEQRNSSFGKEMESQLNSLSQKLNETKKGVGNFKDNIGHYSEGVIDAFSKMGISVGGLQTPLKLASGGIKAFGASLKALIANPVGAIIMAIVLAFKALKAVVDNVKEAINNNEEAQMALSEAMSAFQPILDAISNAWDAVGQAVVKAIGFIGDAVRWIREAGAAVSDFLGITKGAKEQVKEQNELYKELAQSQNALTKQKREYQKLNAKDQAEVERLREEASELENGAEKRRLLNEAKEKQAEIDARNVEIAKEELRILTEQSKLTANSAEDNEKLAAAEAKVAQEEANAARNARTFNKALSGTKGAANDAAAAAKNLYNSIVENSKDELTKLEEKYKKEKELLEKYHYDTTLLTKQYQKERIKILTDSSKEEFASRKQLYNSYLQNTIQTTVDVVKRGELEIEAAETQRDSFKKMLDAWGLIPKEGTKEEALKAAKSLFKVIDDAIGTAMSDDTSWLESMEPGEILTLLRKNYKEALEMLFPAAAEALPKMFNAKTIDEATKYLESYFKVLEKGVSDAKENAENNITEENIKEINKYIEAVKGGLYSNELLKAKDLNVGKEDAIMALVEKRSEALKKFYDYYKNLMFEEIQLEDGQTATVFKIYGYGIEERKEILKGFYATVDELREANWAKEEIFLNLSKEKWQEWGDIVGTSLDVLKSGLETNISLQESKIKQDLREGKITKEEAEDKEKALLKYQKVLFAVEAASVAASTASAIMGVWKAYALEKVANAETAAATGAAAAATLAALNAKSLLSAILQTTGLAATGAAQIASLYAGRVANIQNGLGSGDEGSAAGTVATPTTIESEPYSYARTLQTQEDVDELQARPVWVSVEDISSGLNKVQVRDSEATF